MPNGYYGSKEGWRAIAAPLEALDPELEQFSALHRLAISRDERGWPNRELRWHDDLGRAIEIYLGDERRPTYHVGIAASLDKGGRRFWRGLRIREDATVEELVPELRELLERSYRLVSSWTFDDLEDTGPLD